MSKNSVTEFISLPAPPNWKPLILNTMFIKVSTSDKKVKESDYLPEGKFPIIDQGQTFISGYFNDNLKVINVNSPVIIFGDHTRQVKFIKKDFIPGADGIKVLKPKNVDPRFLYYLIKYLSKIIPSKGYARHFHHLENSNVAIPTIDVQVKIAKKIDNYFTILDVTNKTLDQLQSNLISFNISLMNTAIRGKLLPQVPQDEPASVLIEKIKSEKEALIKAGKLKKEKPLPPINLEEIDFALPKG